MNTFETAAQAEFRGRVAAYLRKHLPQQTAALSAQDLDTKIIGWQQRAAVHGVITERAIAKWSFLCLVTNDTFDELPEIRDYLSQPVPTPSIKVDTLMDALYLRVRQAEEGG